MSKTRHMIQRQGQRSIRYEMVDIVKRFGEQDGEKIVLGRNSIDMALKECRKLIANMERIRNRGGLVVVVDGDVEITTYGINCKNTKHGARSHG